MTSECSLCYNSRNVGAWGEKMAGLSDEIQSLKGIGKKRTEAFGKLGLWQAEDLLYYLPFRYEDRSEIADITRLSNGDNALIFGTIARA